MGELALFLLAILAVAFWINWRLFREVQDTAEEKLHNIQTEEKLRVKNNEKCPLQPLPVLFMLTFFHHWYFFEFLPFVVNSSVTLFLVLSTNQHSTSAGMSSYMLLFFFFWKMKLRCNFNKDDPITFLPAFLKPISLSSAFSRCKLFLVPPMM